MNIDDIDPRLTALKDALYRAATKALIIDGGKLLFVKEKDDDWWNVPGGGIDHGEEAVASLKRELFEEIGLKESDILHVSAPLFVGTNALMDGIPRLNIFYKVQVNLSAITTGEDVDAVKWCTAEEARLMNVSPGIAAYTEEIVSYIS